MFIAAFLRVNPKPSTDTASFRTRRHPSGNLEIGSLVPDTRVVHAEHGEIFGLDLVDVRFVCDRQRASFQVPQTLCIIDPKKRYKVNQPFVYECGDAKK